MNCLELIIENFLPIPPAAATCFGWRLAFGMISDASFAHNLLNFHVVVKGTLSLIPVTIYFWKGTFNCLSDKVYKEIWDYFFLQLFADYTSK